VFFPDPQERRRPDGQVQPDGLSRDGQGRDAVRAAGSRGPVPVGRRRRSSGRPAAGWASAGRSSRVRPAGHRGASRRGGSGGGPIAGRTADVFCRTGRRSIFGRPPVVGHGRADFGPLGGKPGPAQKHLVARHGARLRRRNARQHRGPVHRPGPGLQDRRRVFPIGGSTRLHTPLLKNEDGTGPGPLPIAKAIGRRDRRWGWEDRRPWHRVRLDEPLAPSLRTCPQTRASPPCDSLGKKGVKALQAGCRGLLGGLRMRRGF